MLFGAGVCDDLAMQRVLSRRGFLQSAAAAGTAAAMSGAALAEPHAPYTRISHGLVLSGGGARGAYEAGVIAALAQAAGVTDGEPLAPYGFVCGTSIGALNGWMVATGQYARMRTLWNTIASARILQPKPEFAAIRDPTSGVGTRLQQAIRLVSGLRTNVRGVIQSEPVTTLIKANVDPRLPVLVPFVWTATNVTTQRTEYFYRVPQAVPEERKSVLLEIFRRTIGPSAVLREVPDAYLADTLFASAAIPIVFDPVDLTAADGAQTNQYVDGGVASNTPISLARTVAQNVHVVLLDPPYEPEPYDNAVEIGFAVYGTMQRRILENEVRAVFFESAGAAGFERFARSSPAVSQMNEQQLAALQTYFASAANTQLGYIRPAQKLPLGVGSFSDAAGIQAAIALGEQDARPGFKPFTIDDFLSV